MLNRVILIGRIATDPDAKVTPSGIAVTSFRIAVNRPVSAEAKARGDEQADFIDVVAWRQNAEYAANYLAKGRLVAVEGRLQVRDYVDREGQKRRAYEVVVDNLKGLDRRPDAEGGGDSGYGGGGGNGYERGGGGGYDQGQGEAAPRRSAPAPAAGGRSGGGGGYGSGAPARGGSRNSPPPSNDDSFDGFDDPFAE